MKPGLVRLLGFCYDATLLLRVNVTAVNKSKRKCTMRISPRASEFRSLKTTAVNQNQKEKSDKPKSSL